MGSIAQEAKALTLDRRAQISFASSSWQSNFLLLAEALSNHAMLVVAENSLSRSLISFFHFSKNYACDRLHDWKKLWMQNSRADPNFKIIATYIAGQWLSLLWEM